MSGGIQFQLRVQFIHYQLFIVVYACDKCGVLRPDNNHKRTLPNNSFYSNSLLGDDYNLIRPAAIWQMSDSLLELRMYNNVIYAHLISDYYLISYTQGALL